MILGPSSSLRKSWFESALGRPNRKGFSEEKRPLKTLPGKIAPKVLLGLVCRGENSSESAIGHLSRGENSSESARGDLG